MKKTVQSLSCVKEIFWFVRVAKLDGVLCGIMSYSHVFSKRRCIE